MAEGDNIDPNKAEEATQGAKALEEQLKKLAKAYAELDKGVSKANSGLSKTAAAIKDAEAAGEGLGDTFAGMVGISSGLNKGIQNLLGSTQNAGAMFTGLTKSLKTNFSAMAIGISVMEKMKEATLGLAYSADQALVSFQKQTGAVGTYGNMILGLEAKLFDAGIGIDLAAESTASLVTNIKNLDKMSASSQRELAETTAVLAKMGIDSEITAQNINFLTNSMGMLPEDAASATRSMMLLAKELKTPPQEMASAFKAAQPQLAAFGSRSTQVFQKLALNAHNANMEVADILRITEQFDKFETAANAVGKLNAALGGPYLSTIRMVTTTDPTERIKMMSDAAREAGKSFDDMEYYEAKMLASAMGLKDVNELALVMADRFNDIREPVKLSTEAIVAQEQQLKDYNTIVEEFSHIMRNFAIQVIGPIITGLKGIAGGLTTLTKGPIPAVVAGIGLIIAAVITLGIALAVTTGGLSAVISIVASFMIAYGAGLLLMFKGIMDVVRSSNPFMEKLSATWEKITAAFAKFNAEGAKGSSVMEQITEGFNSFVKDNEKAIDIMLNSIVDSLVSILDNMAKFHGFLSESGIYYGFGKAIGHIAGFVLFLVTATMKLMEIFNDLHHMIFVGNSPSLIAVFELLGNAITAVGEAFKFPIQMIGKLMAGLRDLAALLAGKALSFISGAISYVFGGSPSAEVNNGGFNRGEDMDAMAVSIGEEVGKAVKEALQDMQMNNKVQLEVVSKHGLPTLFDFVQKNLDDVASGRPPNIALNASRAGIV